MHVTHTGTERTSKKSVCHVQLLTIIKYLLASFTPFLYSQPSPPLSSPPTFLSTRSLNLNSPQRFSTSPSAATFASLTFPLFFTLHPISPFSLPSLLHLLSRLFHPSVSSCQLQIRSAYFYPSTPSLLFSFFSNTPSLFPFPLLLSPSSRS